MDFQKAIQAVTHQKSLMMNRFSFNSIEEKGRFDYVTNIDIEIQKNVQKALEADYPGIEFWSEEGSRPSMKSAFWLLDPIDGTTNFIHDYRCSAISLALIESGTARFGCIFNPYTNELFVAEAGKGATLNGQPISVSNNPLEKAVISFGTSPYDKYLFNTVSEALKSIFPEVQDIRRSGSAAFDLSMVACGRTEAFFELILRPWDFAAGLLLVKEAGGKVTTCSGATPRFDLPVSLLAANPKTHPYLLAKIQEVFHE